MYLLNTFSFECIFCETRTKRSVEVYKSKKLGPPPPPLSQTVTWRGCCFEGLGIVVVVGIGH